ELLEQDVDVVQGVRPRRVARQLDLLPRRKLGEDLLLQLARLVLQALDLVAEIDRPLRQLLQLVDLLFQVDDRPLELQDLPIIRTRLRVHPDPFNQLARPATSPSAADVYHATSGSARNHARWRRA